MVLDIVSVVHDVLIVMKLKIIAQSIFFSEVGKYKIAVIMSQL